MAADSSLRGEYIIKACHQNRFGLFVKLQVRTPAGFISVPAGRNGMVLTNFTGFLSGAVTKAFSADRSSLGDRQFQEGSPYSGMPSFQGGDLLLKFWAVNLRGPRIWKRG